MWIDYIKLKNFRQYQDEYVELTGPDKEDGSFNIIKGTNGAGKTNLLNAFTWCLYGKEYHQKKDVEFPILNTKVKKKMEPEEQQEVEVEIQFKDETERMIVTRTKGFRKTKDNNLMKMSGYGEGAKEDTNLQIMKSGEQKKGMEKVESWAIGKKMPKSLHEYFYFDGERLDDYFRETSPKNIKDAVFRISQLKKFDKVITHLEKVKSDYQKESSNLSSQADKIQKKIKRIKDSLKDVEDNLKEKREKHREAQEKEEEYRRKLRDTDVEEVRKFQKERDKLKQEVKKARKKKDQKTEKKLDFLLEEAPKSLLIESTLRTRELLDKKEEAGEIPPSYKKNYIEKLLEKGTCICGEDITSGERRERVREVLEKSDEITNISEELSDLNATLRGIISSRGDLEEKLKNYNDVINALSEEIDEKTERIEEIGPKVNDVNRAKIETWEDSRKVWKNTKEKEQTKVRDLEVKKQRKKEKLDDEEEKLKKELEKQDKGKEIRKKILFCEESLNTAKTIKQKIMKGIRDEVEGRTERQFLNMIWKEKNFQEVKIGEEYEISAIDQLGTDATTTLSAGERQALALSFMAALNNVSGFEAPIIIDTPLGRIDKGEPKRRIAKNLPEALAGKQVTMLVTGSEYTDEVREELTPYIGKEYYILFEEYDVGNVAEVKPL